MTRPFWKSAAMALALAAFAGAAEVPRKAPEYAFSIPNGKQVLLSQYRGKVVAFGFYFTTCPHCQVICQLMEKFSGQLGGKGFQPLGVAFNEVNAMTVSDYMRMYRITFPFGPSSRETVYAFLKENASARGTVPQMVLIDRAGNIRYQSPQQGDEEFFKETTLRNRIEELLREPAGRAVRPAARKKGS